MTPLFFGDFLSFFFFLGGHLFCISLRDFRNMLATPGNVRGLPLGNVSREFSSGMFSTVFRRWRGKKPPAVSDTPGHPAVSDTPGHPAKSQTQRRLLCPMAHFRFATNSKSPPGWPRMSALLAPWRQRGSGTMSGPATAAMARTATGGDGRAWDGTAVRRGALAVAWGGVRARWRACGVLACWLGVGLVPTAVCARL